jgi:uncharacterized metal-binding protein YceD (DUF177 family)
MNEVRNYIILPLRSLERKRHRFEFRVNSGFFSECGNTEIIEGSAEISLDVEKFSHLMNVVLTFSGILTVSCDRCLENFDIPVEGENKLAVMFGKAPDEPTEEYTEADIMYVNGEEDEIDLTVYIYESICLAMPIQRVHGDDENGESLCNPEMLKYIVNRNNGFLNF